MFKPYFPVASGTFLHEILRDGAVALRLFQKEDVAELLSAARTCHFTQRPPQYGPRGVIQHFSACEERHIPRESVVREASLVLCYKICELLSDKMRFMFETPLRFNDHLLLCYPPSTLGLSAHKDESQYRNLIVSVTLAGHARFNIHPHPDAPPSASFATKPGMVVFMRAPGFAHEDVRPYHSITHVEDERVSLVFKQKEV